MHNRAPWPAPGESRVHGPLSADCADEYIARVFRPDPVAEEIEIGLERMRLDRENRILLRETERLARDRAELEELPESLDRLKEPEPRAAPGRPPVLPRDKATLRALRLRNPGSSCKTEFYATLPKDIRKGQQAKRYHDADKGLEDEDKQVR
jgi:hypothetical protein